MTKTQRAAKALLPAKRTAHAAERPVLDLTQTRAYLEQMLGEDVHASRVLSIANGVVGVLDAGVLSVHAIGQAYAGIAGITPRSGVKQVDRLLSNSGVKLSKLLPLWMQFVVAEREELFLVMDWTDFDDDDHTTLCVYVVTTHGRATPLYWKTIRKSQLAGRRTAIEHEAVVEVDQYLAPGIRVTVLADRGFGDQKLYKLLRELGWDYVIRFRGNILVEANGETRTASDWVGRTTQPLKLKGARVTGDRYEVPAVIVVHDRRMKESWCLATSLADKPAGKVVKKYGRRFTVEETFRDVKDLHFGMGLRATHIKRADRRDRLLFLTAIAHALLTLLGAASEAAGLDRLLKVNTVKKRTHSLYRQGRYWYHALPRMRPTWLADLMREFDRIVRRHAVFREALGII